ncbi:MULTISPECIES: spore cortex biosynthesis protein YabQ [Alicyclobacillus]|uniref:Spore cortex biosynthesis protein YabQ n=1 Tax=Alicyclobacillus vulcanalis TaxID=252246 RepID=A0A1N7MIZ3_9BACL|nr:MULTISPECIES: spore cortex biosynthesis protein YabQ [Alicyclobacillus]SIS86042.1 spore cortex biosynthesis protein YabQ [Alicyclobacillus vulcanalis]
MNTTQNVAYVLWMLAAGAAMGAVFDWYNTIATSLRLLRHLRPLCDLAFWVASAICVYLLTFRTIDGEFRIWTLVLVAAGYGLYRVTLRRRVIRGAFAVVAAIRFVARIVRRTMEVLIVWPLRLAARVALAILGVLYRAGVWLEDVVCRILAVAFAVVSFPVRRYIRRDAAWRKKLAAWQEDLWQRASNWLIQSRGQAR